MEIGFFFNSSRLKNRKASEKTNKILLWDIASCYHICMARKKVSTTVYLTEDQVVALKELHERTRVPIAEFIRMGIDLILEKHSEKLPGQVSLFEGATREEFGTRKRGRAAAALEDTSPRE